MKNQGYTLIELVVVIGIMTMIIGAGIGVFYQSLRSGSKIDFELFMNNSSRVIESSMTDVIGFSRVISVAGQDQDVCLAAGTGGILGDSLIIEGLGGLTEYSLNGDYIASSSAGPVVAKISPDGMTINTLSFKWVCMYGEIERVAVDFTAQAEKDGQDVAIMRDYSFEIFLKNSGYF